MRILILIVMVVWSSMGTAQTELWQLANDTTGNRYQVIVTKDSLTGEWVSGDLETIIKDSIGVLIDSMRLDNVGNLIAYQAGDSVVVDASNLYQNYQWNWNVGTGALQILDNNIDGSPTVINSHLEPRRTTASNPNLGIYNIEYPNGEAWEPDDSYSIVQIDIKNRLVKSIINDTITRIAIEYNSGLLGWQPYNFIDINTGGGGVSSWNDLTDIPSGFADDVDDVDDADNDPNNEIQDLSPYRLIVDDEVDDADNDPTNEIQDLSPYRLIVDDEVDDADNDPTNEIETWATLSGIPADIADGDDDTNYWTKSSTQLTYADTPVAVNNDMIIIGDLSLDSGNNNMHIGEGAGSGGSDQVAIGDFSLAATTGTTNVAIGSSSMRFNQNGANNVGVGAGSLRSNTTGGNNVGIGLNALYANGAGNQNNAIGVRALSGNVGDKNVAIGHWSGFDLRTGNNNTFVGYYTAKDGASDLDGCVHIGYEAGRYNTVDNTLMIDNSSTTAPLIYGNFTNNLIKINGSLEVTDLTGGTAVNGIGRDANKQLVDIPLPTSIWATGSGDDIFYNPTNAEVGIGTSTPSARLHVNGGNTILNGDLSVGTTINNATVNILHNNTDENDNVLRMNTSLSNRGTTIEMMTSTSVFGTSGHGARLKYHGVDQKLQLQVASGTNVHTGMEIDVERVNIVADSMLLNTVIVDSDGDVGDETKVLGFKADHTPDIVDMPGANDAYGGLKTSAISDITSTAATKVNFTSVVGTADNTTVSTVLERVTVDNAGVYMVHIDGSVNDFTTDELLTIRVYVNGSNEDSHVIPAYGTSMAINMTEMITLAAADYVELYMDSVSDNDYYLTNVTMEVVRVN